MSRTTHLKIKIRTLAAEARIIRSEEQRALTRARYQNKDNPDWTGFDREYIDLHSHRKGIVRTAARNNLLAYAFLRGRQYRDVEHRVRPNNKPNLKAIKLVAERFCIPPHIRKFSDRNYCASYLKGHGRQHPRAAIWEEFDARWEAWEAQVLAHLKQQEKHWVV